MAIAQGCPWSCSKKLHKWIVLAKDPVSVEGMNDLAASVPRFALLVHD